MKFRMALFLGFLIAASAFSAEADSILLNVPHQSQLDTGCTSGNWCCGIAAVNMGTAYLWGLQPTAQYLKNGYTRLGLNSCCKSATKTGTTPQDQLLVAREIGNAWGSSFNAYGMTWEDLKRALRAGNPVAVSVRYSSAWPSRCVAWTGFHTVTLIGFNNEEGYWVVNDPLCRTGTGRKRISSAAFRSAAEAYSGLSGKAMGVVLKR